MSERCQSAFAQCLSLLMFLAGSLRWSHSPVCRLCPPDPWVSAAHSPVARCFIRPPLMPIPFVLQSCLGVRLVFYDNDPHLRGQPTQLLPLSLDPTRAF